MNKPLFAPYTIAGKIIAGLTALLHVTTIQGNQIGNAVKNFNADPSVATGEELLQELIATIVPGNLVKQIVPFTLQVIEKVLGVDTEGKTQIEILTAAAAKIAALPALIKAGVMTVFSALHSVKVAELQGTTLPLETAMALTPAVYNAENAVLAAPTSAG